MPLSVHLNHPASRSAPTPPAAARPLAPPAPASCAASAVPSRRQPRLPLPRLELTTASHAHLDLPHLPPSRRRRLRPSLHPREQRELEVSTASTPACSHP
ncbi:hypothetical protein PVAP13_3KG462001 [Panicum virgatum]|uniref:Uncharacterized protein n=1 Tax=Panicum virgatum TaxID=38727 RepID=A0A8T0V5R2_PANVG|nr:hypothetical protein PVAP13_3KG462001 [Panicum virgatum]